MTLKPMQQGQGLMISVSVVHTLMLHKLFQSSRQLYYLQLFMYVMMTERPAIILNDIEACVGR